MSRFSSFLPVLIIYIIFIVLRAAGGKNKKAGQKTEKQTPARPTRTAAVSRAAAKAAGKPAAWHPDAEDECVYGEVNHRYSHSSERRVAQLTGYLKAGLIDKKEYAQMLERYTRMDREAGLD